MSKKVLAMSLACLMFLWVMAGCATTSPTSNTPAGDSQGNNAGGSNQYTIAFIPQLIGNTYFETSNEWAQRAGKDLGVNVLYTGSSSSDPASQSNVIQDMITKQVDCIAVSPVDADALAPVLKKAKEAGILVITWDSDVNDKDQREAYVTYCIDQELGENLMKELAKYMNEEGEYAIITSLLTVQNNAAWSNFATKYQEENYPNMKRVAYEPCDDDQSKAYSITQNLMTAYPDLKGLMGVTTPAPPASAQAVREAGKAGEIAVVGIVEPSTSREYLLDGSMQESIIWHPGKLGYLTIYVAKNMLDKAAAITDNQQIPEVGPVRVIGDSIIMDELLYITKDNVDDYDF